MAYFSEKPPCLYSSRYRHKEIATVTTLAIYWDRSQYSLIPEGSPGFIYIEDQGGGCAGSGIYLLSGERTGMKVVA